MATTFHGFVPFQSLAHELGFNRIESRVYERGELVKAPDGHRSALPDEFIVTAHNGRAAHFITPVEWEEAPPVRGLLGAFSEPRYRTKNQLDYVMRMLRECQKKLLTGQGGQNG